jgi:hypothetical protein
MALDLQFTVVFDLDTDSATFGKLVFEDTTDYAAAGYDPADVIGYFNITGPLGVVRTGSFASPDTDGSIPEFTYDGTDIPLVSTEQYLMGGYSFTYYVRIAGSEDFNTVVTYNLCAQGDVLGSDGYIIDQCETHTINTICNILTINNTTDFGSYTTLTPVITLSPPALTGMPDVTANALVLTYTYYWTGVAYSIEFDTLVTYVSGDVTLQIRLNFTFTIDVSPAKLAPQMWKCFIGFVNWYMAQAALKGGAYNLNPVLTSDFQTVVGYIEAFNGATEIGEWATAENLITKIEAIINQYYNCNCGCDTTKPMYVEPYCNCDGSGSSSSYTFLATYPVQVQVTGDTVRYYLDPTWVATIEAITAVTVASSDSSVTVTGGPDYNLTVKNSLAFTAKFEFLAGTDMSVTVSNVQRQGTRYVSGYPADPADIQIIGYPHASIDDLKAEYAVVYVQNFLTVAPGVEISDKLDVSELLVLNAGQSATDFSQPMKYNAVLHGRTTTGFYIQFFDAVTGLPVNMETMIDQLQYFTFTIKINQ